MVAIQGAPVDIDERENTATLGATGSTTDADTDMTTDTTTDADTRIDGTSTTPGRSGWAKVRLIAGIVAVIVIAGLVGWLTPRVAAHYNRPSYLGKPAATVAHDLGCTDYKKAAKHDESVYSYRDQGTCVLDGTVVTITTFDKVTDGETFAAVMRAVIPLLHPTWEGASYAAGDGWNVADTRNLTAKVTELAVRRLGAGAVHVIPSAK